MKKTFVLLLILLFSGFASAKDDKDEKDKSKLNSGTLSGLKFRSIGPAIASGRIIDIAVNPNNFNEFYLAVASGGVWKTTNKGNSFSPIFDSQGSYSTGCVAIAPSNSNVVWVGSGENNSQRSVSYGDGVYRSQDGGKSFKNMGLKESEHTGKIIIDPKDENIVYVASQGPLWRSGGDRGLYKTIDGGTTWTEILREKMKISDNTGVSDIVMDPRDPNVIYASTYQRRRHVWTLINGGPEGAVYKTINGGENWTKLTNGLPSSGYIGRIGLAISPADPDYVYAIVELPEKKGGFYRSTDRGASWTKQKDLVSSSPQYYQELVCDPKDKDIIFSLSTYTSFSEDGGKTWNNLSIKEKHVDDHAMWINPNNSDHFMIGSDGGLYETYDGAVTWRFFENLSLTQFYRVSVDNDAPFYNIYGGTQDNNTLGGPTRTTSANGLTNQDFYFTIGGDGFETVIDPTDPNIIYSQPQYGMLVRYDKKSGETTFIKPQEEEGEELRWNWNSPVIISPFDHKTLYFAANKLFKTTNRGNSWTKISGDLSQGIDRNELEIMGKVWDEGAVAKNASTSLYGNIVSLDESPVKKGLLYVGTDDGLIQISNNDGGNWTKISSFGGIPKNTYVSDLQADLFAENTVYATFDNRKRADFTPYIIKSNDMGKTWKSISGDLPENLPVHSIVQDHVNANLLFIGTEFGVYFTNDGGAKWVKLSSGLPTICIKDIEIQRRENDLALASFGRGFYILDDYSPLRTITEKSLDSEAELFQIKDAWIYVEDRSFGRHSLGASFWRGENKIFGADFTYYIKDNYETLKSKRKKEEKELDKDKKDSKYPSWDVLRAEDSEKRPSIIFEIKDQAGNLIRRLTAPWKKGLQRITWDLRYPDTSPISAKSKNNKNSAFLVMPGKYTVIMLKEHNGEITSLSVPQTLTCKPLDNKSLPAGDDITVNNFRTNAYELLRNIEGANAYIKSAKSTLGLLKGTVTISKASTDLYKTIIEISDLLKESNILLNGDPALSKRNANQPPSIYGRLWPVFRSFLWSSSEPTKTSLDGMKIIEKDYKILHGKLSEVDEKLKTIRAELEKANAPWVSTPSDLPKMK
jgi:photosystem II stability/assembly factor-like uncharacterized protein